MIKAHERRGEILRNQLYLGGLSGRVYFAPKVRVLADHDDGTGLMSVVGMKYDVTEQFDRVAVERSKALRSQKRKAARATS